MKILALLIVLHSDTDARWVLTTMATCEAVRIELLKEYERVFCIAPKDLKTEILEF